MRMADEDIKLYHKGCVKMISKDKKYRTRDGKEARVYATDAGGDYPIHGAVKDDDDTWNTKCWTEGGRNMEDWKDDLIEVKPKVKYLKTMEQILRENPRYEFGGAGDLIINGGLLYDSVRFKYLGGKLENALELCSKWPESWIEERGEEDE